MPTFSVPDFGPALPELVLAIGALALVLLGAIKGDRSRGMIEGAAVLLLVVAGVLVFAQHGRQVTFNGSFISDGFSRFMKLLTIIGSIAAIALSVDWLKWAKLERFEYALLILLATIGMMMMISANDLIALYLGLELQSLALYVIAAIYRDDAKASEAGLKYFVLGALSSGMFLYGASLVYGFTGTVSFAGIAAVLAPGHASLGLIFGLVFVLAGLAFKISAVPFHMWTPDVYEGAPTPVTAFFAAAPKMAAMAMTVRVVIVAFPGILAQWQQVIVFISIASMVLGAFAAIGQNNIKRLMAYSSIGHMGYALVGLAAGTVEGVQGVAVYMALYLVMTLGVFGCILAMRREGIFVEKIDDLSGLGSTNPWLAFALAMLLFSLAGIPPLAGFFAKFYVFMAAINAKLYVLAVIGVIASVVGAYYYLRIIKMMYFDDPRPAFETMPPLVKAVVAISAAVTFLFWIVPAPLIGAAAAAAKSIF